METPSVSSSVRYNRLVQEYREKERAADSVAASAVEKAEAEKERLNLEREKQQVISELSKRDQEVRTHEQAHASVGGRYASAPSYEMTEGPDGRQYATGGHVTIDTSPVPDDPEATLDKSQVVERAALAPVQPSEQDLKVASEARAMGNEARVDIRELAFQERNAKVSGTEEGTATEQSTGIDEKAADTEGGADKTDDSDPSRHLDTGSENQLPSGVYVKPKSFAFGLHFPQTFVGSVQENAAGMTAAQQLKDRFDTLGLSFPPQLKGQKIIVTA